MLLKNSGVQFNEAEHTYFLDGKELQGITGILHRHIFEDKYDGIPKRVLDLAAEYGSGVHATIELCDSLGDTENTDSNYVAYRRLMKEQGLTTIRNEYIVTDREHYASAIDLVAVDANEDIALVDIKTTSKLDEEYVAWQLSIYRHLFYLQNPELEGKVKYMFGLWLPKPQYGSPKLIRVLPKTSEEVLALLQADISGEKFEVQKKEENTLPVTNETIFQIIDIERQLSEAKAQEDALKKGLLELMQKFDVKSFKNSEILLTRVIPSSEPSFTIDSAKLKQEMPEIYEKYKKKKATPSESIRIKIY